VAAYWKEANWQSRPTPVAGERQLFDISSCALAPEVIAPLVLARSATALDHIQGILGALAASMEKSQSPTLSDEHAALRSTLSAVEQATSDGERERASGLGIPFPAKQFARRWLLCGPVANERTSSSGGHRRLRRCGGALFPHLRHMADGEPHAAPGTGGLNGVSRWGAIARLTSMR
jgi:hypothetical protein